MIDTDITNAEYVYLNVAQQRTILLAPKNKVHIGGRGIGKSYEVGWTIDNINKMMPRAITSVTGTTFGQLLTRTLPSTFKFLQSLGYKQHNSKKDPGNYVIGQKPPPHFFLPYEKIMKHDNMLYFSNGNAITLFSQDRIGSARGPNVDYEILDEALTINKTRYDEETSPTNRGNKDKWGENSLNPVPWHHGFHYVSSMPYSKEQKWLLDYAKYYEEEKGIRILEIWNRIVKLQVQLIDAKKDGNLNMFRDLWNETVRLRQKIAPFVSQNGTLFTLSNALDNVKNVGFSYILDQYDKLPLITFLVEIMNMVLDVVEDCYYSIDSKKHIYYDSYNDSFLRDYASNTNWDFVKLGSPDSRFDLDCDPSKPLEIAPDWGAKIALFSVAQERYFDFVSKLAIPTDNFINEFYTKPDQTSGVMINDLVDSFCKYYEHHACKEIIYYHDKYGDHKQPNAKNSETYNQQAIARFNKNNWRVISKLHKGMEPPQHEKYLLWSNILKKDSSDALFPNVRFNGNKCKFTLISMNNTKVVDKNGKWEKDKSSERKNSVLPEEATHFGDACDKRIWTKYSQLLNNKFSIFVPARYGS
jgi:hypothetical protein